MTTPLSDLVDAAARARIATDLTTNLLVEAGAGSGKTTALVERMIALIASGVLVENIAAVTFTRRAADELREPFLNELEASFRRAIMSGTNPSFYEAALRDLPRAFTGTIHAFCGRLLRDRPIEIGLDPCFQEVTESEWEDYKRSFWNEWLERAALTDDQSLIDLHAVGIEPRSLSEAFTKFVEYSDVEFEAVDTAAPDFDECRQQLNALLDRAYSEMPQQEPDDGWDPLMGLVRRLRFNRRTHDWSRRIDFCQAIGTITSGTCKVTQKRWGSDKAAKTAAKQLGEDFAAWTDGVARDTLRQWREHRYPAVIRFLSRAAESFAKERRSTGRLGFTDLLLLSAKLLRENPAARNALGRQYQHLLVDEFQDTDPIQAEVCLLVSSDSDQGTDWRNVQPRPGGLFVVGDPKQSIYRFRRADIETYNLVRARFAVFGDVLTLNVNFRSTKPVEKFVNAHFATAFPEAATERQAGFTRMVTHGPTEAVDGVFRYTIDVDGQGNQELFRNDAESVAAWIEQRIKNGERVAGDFLILTQTRAPLETYARAIAEREIAVDVAGAELLQEYELRELLVLLRALADPENAVLVAAVLEGLFFGLSPADLFDAHQLGHTFAITAQSREAESPVGVALSTLNGWWKMTRHQPADVVMDRILDNTGLLVFAAGEPIGESRSGALLHLVDELRTAGSVRAMTMSAAIIHIEALLQLESDDTPLRPGRTDAVRIMNLHRAKGLEAEVVVLAAPANSQAWEPDLHVRRTEQNAAAGWMQVSKPEGSYKSEILAQPPNWQAMADEELEFIEAERVRLLYVATTRAKHELVVSRCIRSSGNADSSQWSKLSATLSEQATEITLPTTASTPRAQPETTRDDVLQAVIHAAERVRAGARPTMRTTTVTRSAKAEEEAARIYDIPREPGLGAAWGRAVHGAIEAMGRGLSDEPLSVFVKAIAMEEELPDGSFEKLERLLAELHGTETWTALMASSESAFELPIMRAEVDDHGVVVITEGVIDAVGRDETGWKIVDWKTDKVGEEEWANRSPAYERQIAAYADMLRALTGVPASGQLERIRQ